jgi:hypothetical protein
MSVDPRLQNVQLLALAAFRIQQRQQRAVPDWQHTVGLAALLEAAKQLPPREPGDLEGVYEDAPGFGGLLWQARQWQQEDAHGA